MSHVDGEPEAAFAPADAERFIRDAGGRVRGLAWLSGMGKTYSVGCQPERANSLTQTSIDVLNKMNGPIAVTVYATQQDAQLGSISKIIGEFLALYQRAKPDLAITFVDPDENPQRAQAAGVQLNGEMVVEFNGRQERLATFNEQALPTY